MANNIDRFEDLLTEELLDSATEEALGALAKPLKESFTKIIAENERIAKENHECKSLCEKDHQFLVDTVSNYGKFVSDYGKTVESYTGLVDSVKALKEAKQKAPLLIMNDEHIKKIEETVLKSKPPFRIRIDFNRRTPLVIATIIIAVCEFGLGFLTHMYGFLTPAERLAIEEYRAEKELGRNHPGESYDYVMNNYQDSPEEMKKKVQRTRERLQTIRNTRSTLSKEYSERLVELFPEGLEVKDASKKRDDVVGDAIIMDCIDKNTLSHFSIFVNPAGKVYINYESEQINIYDITTRDLNKNWSEVKIK